MGRESLHALVVDAACGDLVSRCLAFMATPVTVKVAVVVSLTLGMGVSACGGLLASLLDGRWAAVTHYRLACMEGE